MSQQDSITTLKAQWACLLPGVPVPPDSQFALWLRLHKFETVEHGVKVTAAKNIRAGFVFTADADYAVRYASKAMNVRAKQDRQIFALLESRLEREGVSA